MRIAIISEYFHPDNSGGVPTDLSELACYLKQNYADIEIDVLTSQNLYRPSGVIGKLLANEDWHGVKIRRFRTPKSNRPSMALRLLAGGVFSVSALFYLISHRSYDVLLIVTSPPTNAMAAWVYAKLEGVPYVYCVNDLYPDIAVALGRLNSASFVFRLSRWLQKLCLNAAARTVVVGRCMRQHIHSHYGVPLPRIAVIRNWADPVQIYPTPRENSFRQANNLSGFVVLYGGNFSRYVDFDQVLGAARLLIQNHDISFVLIGDGVMKSEILARVEKEGLKNVRVMESVARSAMSAVLGAADACLISLVPQMMGLGSPGKLYSIMAAGRPVVAMVAEGSEVAQILAEEACGFNVPDGIASALVSALQRLREDPALARGMGQRARSALERRFTLAQAATEFFSVFKEVTMKQRSCD